MVTASAPTAMHRETGLANAGRGARPALRLQRARCGAALAALLGALLATTASAQNTFPKFPPGAVWNQDISALTPDPNSTTMTGASVGWGTGTTNFQIDFSMHVLYTAGQSTTSTALVEESGYYLPDCDTGMSVPLPARGAIEGSTNYTCDLDNDCHLFVVDGNNLYESYQTTVDSNGLNSLCLVKWRLDLVYPQNGRGDGCTSADAAGFPMAPLIFGPDEVHAAMQIPGGGDLGHAIRFVMPNNRMRRDSYVYPASHSGAPSSTSPNAIPYGARLRLQSGFDISGYNPAAQVILRTLKKYGMFLSDGGSVPLTADDGMFATYQWTDADINIDSHSLFGVALSNFDVMPIGVPIQYDSSSDSSQCIRNHFGEGSAPTFPSRILDTRTGYTTSDGLFAGGGALAAGASLNLTVAGRGGVPGSGAIAAMFNLTATDTTASGFVTAWPSGGTRPVASNLNFDAGQTVPNLVVSKLSSGGKVSLFNSAGKTDLIADSAWYFTAASQLKAIAPARLLDTRAGATTVDGQFQAGGALGAKQQLDLLVAGRAGLPANPAAVIMNITATGPTAAGFITAWPTGQARPLASNLNFTAGQTVPNLVLTGVSNTGYVSLYNSAGNTNLIADIAGWLPGGATVTPVVPARLLDTRTGGTTIDGQFAGGGALGTHGSLDLTVVGRGGVPVGGATAVVLNVTAVTPTGTGFVTVWPTGYPRPSASNLNFVPGQTRPNLVVATLGSAGAVSIFNSNGQTQIIVDVIGWITPDPS